MEEYSLLNLFDFNDNISTMVKFDIVNFPNNIYLINNRFLYDIYTNKILYEFKYHLCQYLIKECKKDKIYKMIEHTFNLGIKKMGEGQPFPQTLCFYKDSIFYEIENNFDVLCKLYNSNMEEVKKHNIQLKIKKQKIFYNKNKISTEILNELLNELTVEISAKHQSSIYIYNNCLFIHNNEQYGIINTNLILIDLNTFIKKEFYNCYLTSLHLIKANYLLFAEKRTSPIEDRFILYNIANSNTTEINNIKKKYATGYIAMLDDDYVCIENTLLKLCNINDIPDDEQCIICFEKTEKDKIIVPCGHRQYCVKCIYKIKSCSLCRQDIEKIINIY